MVARQAEAPVIVVGSHKGGVGRTATSVNLAAMIAWAGRRTLLVDLDPKGDASANLGLPRECEGCPRERLCDAGAFLQAVRPVAAVPGLDVWTGGPALEELRRALATGGDACSDFLDRGLRLARSRYRAIVIDAPPALDPLGCNALAAADVLLLPLTGAAFTDRALEDTLATARRLCRGRRHFAVVGVRVGVRVEEFLTGTPPSLPDTGGLEAMLLETPIAYDAQTLLRAADAGVPVFAYAPGSRAARSFLELGREVIARIVEAPLVT